MSLAAASLPLAPRRDDPAEQWRTFLAGQLDDHWQIGSWDVASGILTVDPFNEFNDLRVCQREGCGNPVATVAFCLSCRRLATRAGLPIEAPTPPSPSVEPLTSNPLDLSDPAVAAHDEKLRADGADIIASGTVTYTPDADSDSGTVQPQAFPSGCGLSVWLYFDSGNLTIISDNLTSCAVGYTNGSMDSTIYFWAWLNWYTNPLVSDSEYDAAGTSFTMAYDYDCNNTNTTNYRTETFGEIYIGGTRYTAAAYDETGDVSCGT